VYQSRTQKRIRQVVEVLTAIWSGAQRCLLAALPGRCRTDPGTCTHEQRAVSISASCYLCLRACQRMPFDTHPPSRTNATFVTNVNDTYGLYLHKYVKVRVCVCVCVCTNTHKYTHVHTHTHTKRIDKCVSMLCVCTQMQPQICTCIHAHIQTYTTHHLAHVTHTHTLSLTHTDIHTHTHKHTQRIIWLM